MINKQRVQRIRAFLYTCILLIILVPVVLMLVVSFQTLTVLKQIDEHLLEAPAAVSDQQIRESSSSGNAGASTSSRELSSSETYADSSRSEVVSPQSDATDSLPLPEFQPESQVSLSDQDSPEDTLAEGGGSAPGGAGAPADESAPDAPYLDHVPNTGHPEA